MTWLRWDASYLDHPQVVLMDWQGQVYFWVACMVCKLFSFRGKLPHKFADPRYIARRLPGMAVAEMEKGRTQAVDAGLMEEEEGGWRIIGWKKMQQELRLKLMLREEKMYAERVRD